MDRRKFIVANSVALTTCFAGCASDTDNTENSENGTDNENETDIDPETLPEGFSETGINDIEQVTNHIRTSWSEKGFEFTFEPILTNFTRSIRLQGSERGELHGILANQDPGADRDELRESELYSPPENETMYVRIDYSDNPEYNQGDRTEFVTPLIEILMEELTHFSYSYVGKDTYEGDNAHIFDITGAADEDLNWGTGVPYDQFERGKTVISEAGVILEHSYEVTDTDTGETAEPEWQYRTVDEVQISRPNWVAEVEG